MSLKLDRRAALTALFAGAALAVPAVAATPATAHPVIAESPELLALGAEVDMKLEAYRAAAGCLVEARTIAKDLWPDVPQEIVTTHEDRRCYQGYSREQNAEGKDVWPAEFIGADGKLYGSPPRQLFVAEPLREFVSAVGMGPRTKVGRRFKAVIAAAEKYEAACDRAIMLSGIKDAKDKAQHLASDIHSMLFKIREHAPRSMVGVLILAGAIMALEEAQTESDYLREHAGGLVLGRDLADAVLRLSPRGGTDA